jgi:formylglycine-generating enzyme required for sulfatase activity
MQMSGEELVRDKNKMVWIPGGTFVMGSNRHYPEEAPAHAVNVDGFWMDVAPVTNTEFAQFIEATAYVTVAEKPASFDDYPDAVPELLAPSSAVFHRPAGKLDLADPYSWWTYVEGASWRHPRGPSSTLDGLWEHPVVHIAYADAEAYAAWARKQLPTEAEWERAARGGLEAADYVWGNEMRPGGQVMANTWHGTFPVENTREHGYEWTSPVGAFPANGYGLFDMAGNVWEWTSDFFQEHRKAVRACCAHDNPRGGSERDSIDALEPMRIARRVVKGGSFLCAPSYCHRFRPAARMAQPVDTSTCHLGFRCVVRAPRH